MFFFFFLIQFPSVTEYFSLLILFYFSPQIYCNSIFLMPPKFINWKLVSAAEDGQCQHYQSVCIFDPSAVLPSRI